MTSELELLRAALRFSQDATATTKVWPDQLPQTAPCPLPAHLAGLLGTIESRSVSPLGGYSARILFAPFPNLTAHSDWVRSVMPEFLVLGWSVPPRPQWQPSGLLSQGNQARLEVKPERVVPQDPPLTLIHDESQAVASWSVVPEGEQFWPELQVRTGHVFEHVKQPGPPMSRLPALWPPPASHVQSLASGGGGNAQGSVMVSVVVVRGHLSALGILEHYAGQLRALGWHLRTALHGDVAQSTVWATAEGALGLLHITEQDSQTWQVALQVTQVQSEPPDGSSPGRSWFSF